MKFSLFIIFIAKLRNISILITLHVHTDYTECVRSRPYEKLFGGLSMLCKISPFYSSVYSNGSGGSASFSSSGFGPNAVI